MQTYLETLLVANTEDERELLEDILSMLEGENEKALCEIECLIKYYFAFSLGVLPNNLTFEEALIDGKNLL